MLNELKMKVLIGSNGFEITSHRTMQIPPLTAIYLISQKINGHKTKYIQNILKVVFCLKDKRN